MTYTEICGDGRKRYDYRNRSTTGTKVKEKRKEENSVECRK
jgi:hypothetical protein